MPDSKNKLKHWENAKVIKSLQQLCSAAQSGHGNKKLTHVKVSSIYQSRSMTCRLHVQCMYVLEKACSYTVHMNCIHILDYLLVSMGIHHNNMTNLKQPNGTLIQIFYLKPHIVNGCGHECQQILEDSKTLRNVVLLHR